MFASSVAVFGGALPAVVQDHTALNPQSSYGTQKAIGELLVSDYSRRGFIDGRALRLPTIVIRPGRPNQAASSFASSIVREPLSGRVAVCPVAAATRLWVMSPRQAIESLVLGHDLPAAALGEERSINLPGLTVSVAEMVAGIAQVAGSAVTDLIRWDYDPIVDRIVSGWPAAFDTARAQQLGFSADADFESVIRAYVADEAIVVPWAR
jgi:nucleoside-diphosphate-sugar epimerase